MERRKWDRIGMKRFRLGMAIFLAFLLLILSSCADPLDTSSSAGAGEGSIADASSRADGSSAVSMPADDSIPTPEASDGTSSEPDESEEPVSEPVSEPEHVHAFVGATCTEAGVCECGETDVALGHDFTEATCTEPSACTRCGTKNGDALGHDNAGVTCDEPGVCSRCGEKGSALGHDFAGATCTAPSTCKRCGATEGSALGHTYSGGKCKRCGDTNGPLSPEDAKLFKNKLTDEENAQALAVARRIAGEIEELYPNGSDLDRIGTAAVMVSNEYYKGVHLESGNYYSTAYGVFVKRESSCAGCSRALGLVLSCMGYQWTHVNENQWTHQWVTVDVGGETIWADGQVGWAGYGEHPLVG